MVDFNKLRRSASQKPIEPQELFHSLVRQSGKDYLRDVQKDVLDLWFKDRDRKDTVVKMNTGAGKTLVGLLLLQSSINEGKGPALYLSPNEQLVKQVLEQAVEYGIETVADGGGQLPLSFTNSKAILVLPFQTFFHGFSRFGVSGGSRQVVQVGSLLVDDVHSCLARAREKVTLTFKSGNENYEFLFNLFKSSLEQQSKTTTADIENGVTYATLTVPHWAWRQNIGAVVKALGKSLAADDDLKFSWPLMVEDLELYQCVVGAGAISLFPYAVPIARLPSFGMAQRRFFLSATLIDDSVLVRDFHADPVSVGKPLRPNVRGDIGERLILAPQLLSSDLTRESMMILAKDIAAKGYNTVALVSSRWKAEEWEKLGATFPKKEAGVSKAVEELHAKTGQFLVLANRYDGIDLPGNSCRILVMDGLPTGGLNYEQYLMHARPGSPQLAGIQAQRIEQGMGRGVRAGSDYCVVLLLGADLATFVGTLSHHGLFSPETRKQIEIGSNIADSVKTGGSDARKEVLSAIVACLGQDKDWKKYHREELSQATQPSAPSNASIELASMELEAIRLFKANRATEAAQLIRSFLGTAKGLVAGDVGWYLQLASALLDSVEPEGAQELQRAAHEKNAQLTRPLSGVTYQKLAMKAGLQAHRVLEVIQKFGKPNALVVALEELLLSASFGVDADTAEDAWRRLGEFMGFEAQRPDAQFGYGPDVLWNLNGELFLPTELKTEVKLQREAIYKKEAGQLAVAGSWFAENYPGRQFSLVLVHPTNILATDAHLPSGARVITSTTLLLLHGALRDFASGFSAKPMAVWTAADVGKALSSHKLTPSQFVAAFSVPWAPK